MSQFHNPFHFVPAKPSRAGAVSLGDFDQARGEKLQDSGDCHHLTHDRFVAGTHSGQLDCLVTVETPLICANRQLARTDWTKLLEPYTLGEDEPALPASGLRGMLSAVIEAASGSNMRVLKDTAISHRMALAEESLSAMGILVARGEELYIQPLTVPTVDACPPRGSALNSDELPNIFRTMFPVGSSQPLLKAYVNGYMSAGRNSPLKTEPNSFLCDRNPLSKSADNHEFWYGKLAGTVTIKNRQVIATREIRDFTKKRFLVAQQLQDDPIPQEEYDGLSETAQAEYTRGFLRILGIRGREKVIPNTKKHEYFIPYPVGSEKAIPSFSAQEAVRRFHQLADQRTGVDSSLPFSVSGSNRNSTDNRSKLRLRAGDLVYFRPDAERPALVGEVSVSSIWRAGNGSVFEYFADVSPELLPMGNGRQSLSLAEQLLGAVEEQDGDSNGKPALALAGRLRISSGRLIASPKDGPWQPAVELFSSSQCEAMERNALPDIPLQNLASPKLPAPSLYFRPKEGQEGPKYVSKSALAPGSHIPLGRKFYLRRDPTKYDASESAFVHPDCLSSPEERASISRQHQSVQRFVRPSTQFRFTLDYHNLSDLELQCLVYSLRPHEDFRYQLGHGKPLGLGQIEIGIERIRRVDRIRRYATDSLLDERWHVSSSKANDSETGSTEHENAVTKLRRDFQVWAHSEAVGLGGVLQALELIGKPIADGTPIHYPQVEGVKRGTAPFQSEHYKWFVKNDETGHARIPGQYLIPLIEKDGRAGRVLESLPKLHRRQSSAPPPTVSEPVSLGTSPQSLVHQVIKATVVRHVAKGRKTTVEFQVEYDGPSLVGMVEGAYTHQYPVGDGTVYDLEVSKVYRPRNEGESWLCILRIPV